MSRRLNGEVLVLKRGPSLLVLTVTLMTGIACSPSPTRFDSREWTVGTPWSRGAMVGDLIGRKALIGKTGPEIQALLGPPDYKDNAWYGYKVVTISRCQMWECRIDVAFDKESGLVADVEVSD